MTRLAMPDGAVTGVTVEGAQTGREKTYSGRIVDVTDKQHIRALRDLGAFPVNALGGPARPDAGFRCATCRFASWFRTCSRCGAACQKESS